MENRVKQVANIATSNGDFDNPQRGRIYDVEGIAPTLTTMQGGGLEPKIVERDEHIRRLTPRECFRLMGLEEAEIDTIQAAGISNSQQYKLAGNSIVVDVLAKIFEQLLKFNFYFTK